jgi:hypothetical protein
MKLIFFHDKNLNFICSYFSIPITLSELDFNMLIPIILFLFSLLQGNGSTQRTPSAWLLPHANRVALRASTETNYDVGSDTVSRLQPIYLIKNNDEFCVIYDIV